MTTQYFRITAYDPKHDISFIIDSNGMFEKLWQFSSFVISKGCKVLEVSTDEKFTDLNIEKLTGFEPDKIMLRASNKGKPNYAIDIINGVEHRIVGVDTKSYIPE